MKHDHFVVQSPDKPAQQLLLLFHGVGDNPVAMGEIGSWFAPLFPDALVVSVGGAEPSGNPAGRQWFSVQGITEDNRQARVDAIMPTFIETVRYWQKQSGVGANATALIGFSQGAIMALESIKAEPGLASRVIALTDAMRASGNRVYSHDNSLDHGGEDPVIDLAHAVAAQEALISAGGDVTLDIVEDLGHAIDNRSMQFALDHLRYTIPKHYFDEALSGGKPGDDDVIEMM